jgi:2-C-methyl-D-erythritol 2,4-cyclodiphosphate synthase
VSTGRVGIGYDSHRFAAGGTLVLGGVEVPDSPGLQGYSDSDALTHAVIDAVVGAAGLGDIGRLYPDTDARYENAESVGLLADAVARVREAGWRVANVDATVICERPRLAPHSDAMCARLAGALGVEPRFVNVKATTNEGMGFVGRGEGIAAIAVAQLEREPQSPDDAA